MPMKRKPDEVKFCAGCGERMSRKRYANGKLESNLEFHRRKYCDKKCMAKGFSEKPKKKDASWMTAHYHARKICPPSPCEICGSEKSTEVHHKNGNWRDNRPENLMRVCRSCHVKQHKKKGACSICGKPQKGLGYCEKHYQRFKKYGDPMMTAYGPRP